MEEEEEEEGGGIRWLVLEQWEWEQEWELTKNLLKDRHNSIMKSAGCWKHRFPILAGKFISANRIIYCVTDLRGLAIKRAYLSKKLANSLETCSFSGKSINTSSQSFYSLLSFKPRILGNS